MIIDWEDIRNTLVYCWRERRQPHRAEAALWDCHNWHRELNSRNRRTREKAREAYHRRQSCRQKHGEVQPPRDS
jgi:hypothetical protein